jgi:hypothetical protein
MAVEDRDGMLFVVRFHGGGGTLVDLS